VRRSGGTRRSSWQHTSSSSTSTEGRAHDTAARLYALDRELGLDRDAGKPELEQAIEGHILTSAELVGTYER
jgi:phosphatidylethanolamine-binding protein (PEBP) family uncharacterized protein